MFITRLRTLRPCTLSPLLAPLKNNQHFNKPSSSGLTQPSLHAHAHYRSSAKVAGARVIPDEKEEDVPLLTNAPSNLSILNDLSKARLSALVVMTTSSGFLLAGGPVSWGTMAGASFGTALAASSASTFNQVIEVERDRKMKRTRNRPLPRGVVTRAQASLLGVGTGLSGTALLWATTDPVTTALGLSNILLYALPYTLMKPHSEMNTWVGALVGAIPPVMGWTAAGGSVTDPEALLLGSTLFLWQFPHFFALSWMHRVDYARGGFKMIPCNDPNGDRTASLITKYAMLLAPIPIIASVADLTSYMFAVEGLALNAYFIYVTKQFDYDRTNAKARHVFLTSLWYLPVLLILFILHSKNWDYNKKENEKESDFFYEIRNKIMGKGVEICPHEVLGVGKVELPCPAHIMGAKGMKVEDKKLKRKGTIVASVVVGGGGAEGSGHGHKQHALTLGGGAGSSEVR